MAFNSVDSFKDEVRRLRRDLPHLIQRVMATFQGDEVLTDDLQHELVDCVQEDAFQVADWMKLAAEEGDELRKLSPAQAPTPLCGGAKRTKGRFLKASDNGTC